mmetsp:Transcript_4264/g.10123  ORF Transcript_4264/g.10123 Transcript_4264/m.10123 type:complete len:380 (-) Transcript_4264:878-2017(-)
MTSDPSQTTRSASGPLALGVEESTHSLGLVSPMRRLTTRLPSHRLTTPAAPAGLKEGSRPAPCKEPLRLRRPVSAPTPAPSTGEFSQCEGGTTTWSKLVEQDSPPGRGTPGGLSGLNRSFGRGGSSLAGGLGSGAREGRREPGRPGRPLDRESSCGGGAPTEPSVLVSASGADAGANANPNLLCIAAKNPDSAEPLQWPRGAEARAPCISKSSNFARLCVTESSMDSSATVQGRVVRRLPLYLVAATLRSTSRNIDTNTCRLAASWSSKSRNPSCRSSSSTQSRAESISVCELWLLYTSEKLEPTMVTGSATTKMPMSIPRPAMSLPGTVTGRASPYPTVVIVTTAHQHAAGMLWNGSGGMCPSTKLSSYGSYMPFSRK